MSKINEQEFIMLYNQGKDDYDISCHFNCGERTVQKMGHVLRKEGKILPRKELNTIKPKAIDIVSKINMESCDDNSLELFKKKMQLDWKVEKSKIKKDKNKPYKIMLVTSDHHIPHHNVPAMKSIFKLMDDVKFDINVILGDFLDCSVISHWNQNKRRTLEMQRLKKDYVAGNIILDEFDKRLPENAEKHILFGNHDWNWIEDLLESMPQLEGLIEPSKHLNLKERGYKSYPYNEIVPFGRLNLTHGIYANSNPIKKHLDELKVNVLFGHTHQLGMMFSSSAAREIAFAGYNIGCVCDMAPDYMKNRPHAWNHGFAIVYLYPNGYFDVSLIRIINGKFVYNGKIYNGN